MFTIVAGTRPEIIKLAPVYFELKNKDLKPCWIHSGQHNSDTYRFFDITPDEFLRLDRKSNSLSELTSSILAKFDESAIFKSSKNIIVHGDTTTALCAALFAYYNKKNVFHVESGLRTYQEEPFPEEKNRELIARLTCMNFAPTEVAKNNLIKEGIPENKILVTGNTIVDSTLYAKSKFSNLTQHKKRTVIVTAHRRENWGEGIKNICKSLNMIGESHAEIEIIFPVHPNPELKKTINQEIVSENITLCEPLDYGEMLEKINQSWLVITDSGGIQEECVTLQKPVLVLRNTTERNEVITLGAGKLVGTDVTLICSTFNKLWNDSKLYSSMKLPLDKNPYGDGKAADKIVEYLNNFCNLNF